MPYWVVGEGSVAYVHSSVSAEFVEQPVIGVLDKLVERREVWLTVATAFAAAEERVDAMMLRRRDEAAPC